VDLPCLMLFFLWGRTWRPCARWSVRVWFLPVLPLPTTKTTFSIEDSISKTLPRRFIKYDSSAPRPSGGEVPPGDLSVSTLDSLDKSARTATNHYGPLLVPVRRFNGISP